MAFKMKKFSGFGKGTGKGAPMNFNAGLRKASKEGKLDNNPKFKAAVDNAPVKMKKEPIRTGPNTQSPRQLSPEEIKKQGKKLKRMVAKGKVKKIITDVNQGAIGAVKRKESPKKFLGKAIKSVGKFAKKNPGLVGGLVGGPAGMLAGKAIGGMLMKKAPNKMKKKK